VIEYDLDALCVLTEAAARFFVAEVDGSWVPGYLAGRGFGSEIWRPWSTGYAPARWTALTDHLRGLGFSALIIEAAGLAKRSVRGPLIDVFRDRLMFPVRAADGTVTGFIGRGPPGSRAGPVYLNSPTTLLYQKGRVLFGLHEALPALAEGARPVIAEGPLDAIAVTAAGRSATGSRPRYVGLAPCGTALTPTQVTLLCVSMAPSAPQPRHPLAPSAPQPRHPLAPSARQPPHPLAPSARKIGTRWHHRHVGEVGVGGVVIAFDGDRAGRRAAVRAFDLLRDGFGEVGAALFPADADPADYLLDHGAAALAALLDAAVPLADLVVDASLTEFDRWLEFTDGRFAALRATAPLVAGLPVSQVARQVARVADHLDLSYAEVTEAVTTALSLRMARSSLAAISSSRSTPAI
jgi:DNA primase